MSEQLSSGRPSFISMMGRFMAGAVVLGVVLVGGFALVSTMQADSDATITEAIGTAIGEIEGAHAEAQMMQEADFRHRLALADAEVKRLSDYYSALYQAMGVAAQQAAQWEGDLIRRQAQTVSSNNVVETIGANVLSIGCIGAVLDPSSADARGMCDAANQLGGSMVDEYEALPQHRPRYVEDALSDFPHPTALISSEYMRIQAEFPGAYPDDD